MASFQAKIVLKRPTKRENKNYRFVLFLPDALQNISKKQQRNSKNKKYNYGFISSQNRLKENKKENKNYSFVPSLLDAELKIPKILQNNLKN